MQYRNHRGAHERRGCLPPAYTTASSGRSLPGASSQWRALGVVTKRCRATLPATVDGALPSSRAISRHGAPRSSILSMELRSCLASLEYDLSGPRQQIGCCGAWPSTQPDMFRWVRDVFR